MFQNLSDRLNKTLSHIKGQGRLTNDNIKKALRDVRMALLEADVSLNIVKNFINDIKKIALGKEVMESLTPGQSFIKVVQKQLEKIMGEENEELNLKAQPPVIILLAGLQGSGKTTTSAKLAKFLKEKHKKKVLLTSVDIYRPAAIEQLHKLANDLNIDCFDSDASQKPLKIAQKALKQAKKELFDVLIVDTAGRLHIDNDMMDEIKVLHNELNPTETLFIVDSMTGQDAANTAKAFNDNLELTGVILTKIDGDSRGGAALSVKQVTGKPIKFLGVGEKSDALEPFYPDRMASRILGMGDILSLIEEVEQKVDRKKADNVVKKLKKGKSFTLIDFKEQLVQMQNMGGISKIATKLPGLGNINDVAKSKINDKMFLKMIAIIDSMTKQERIKPEIIKSSRKIRISKGCGVSIPEINKMLAQFTQMKKVMKNFSGKKGMGKIAGLMSSMKGMGGGMPNMGRMMRRR